MRISRIDILNYLAENYNLQSYLEIGVQRGASLNKCIISNKLGVDPYCDNYSGEEPMFCGTSDEFFLFIDDAVMYDLIFIDGFHEAKQVSKDITNSLNHISDKGFIVLHDCNPPTEYHARSYEEFVVTGGQWNGDVYKGYIETVKRNGLNYETVDTDWGIGIIKPPKSNGDTNFLLPEDWHYFDKNRVSLLNLINVESFKEKYKNESSR